MNKLVKALALVLCVVALVGGSVAGTLAYLSMKTAPVKNTFTAGNINITLTQATITPEKIIPGATYTKNPQVTVESGSEACYLFVKIDGIVDATATASTEGEEEKVETPLLFSNYLTYAIGEGWEELSDGIYYRVVDASDANAGATFSILASPDSITANPECTKADYDKLDGKNLTLSITAYAVQKAGFASATAAWGIAETLG